ncbi:hypothetical protein WR25_21795 [Diploscapter pachys]|uniref:Major facilitator superfamily (MFS) profile domain-containing protein n=1 Tax=Diploscapter pachys TaxID=2018661 RepID=A0A2A2L7V9_9BILA|nr:hypothetical protein WR25_21795 [Diploscapter pachys]
MLPGNIIYMIVVYSVFGLGGDILGSLISVFPNQLNGLFNATLYNHYGIHADSTLLSFGISFMSLISFVSLILGIFLLIPFMDSKGRRFCSVYLRFYMTVIPALMMEIGIIWESAEILILGFFIMGLSLPVRAVVLNIYIAECSPDKYREDVIDSIEKEKNLTVEEKLSIKDIWRSETLREALLIVLSFQLFTLSSPIFVEKTYTVILHTSMGLTVDQSMMLNFLLTLIFGPFKLIGSYFIEKYGRRFVLFLSAAIIYSKVVLMFAAQFIVYFYGPSNVTAIMAVSNEVLTEICGLTGLGAIGALFITELFPPSARVSMSQLDMMFVCFTFVPMIVSYPIITNLFAPGFYIPIMFLQPLFIFFLYKKLPETKNRAVYDIVRTLDEDVRSRLDMMFVCFSSMPMIVSYPIITNLFAPGFYIPIMFLQPLFIFFLYKKFPETKNRAVYDIVRTLDEDGGSIISFDFGLGRGLASVMRKRSNTYYYHQTETTPLLFDDSLNRPRANSETNRRVHWNPPKYTQIL